MKQLNQCIEKKYEYQPNIPILDMIYDLLFKEIFDLKIEKIYEETKAWAK